MLSIEDYVARLRAETKQLAENIASLEAPGSAFGEADGHGRKTSLKAEMLSHQRQALAGNEQILARHDAGEI